jgi:hypothetical protein
MSRVGDNFGIIGSIPGSSSGANYTLRWHPDRKDWPSTGEGMVIDSPAAYGLILVRILVKNNNTDLAHVQQLIDACKLSEGKPHHSKGVAPFSFDLFANLSASNLANSILNITARTEKAVPPFNVPHPRSVTRELARAGIHGGSYHTSTNVNLTLAGNEAIAAVEGYSGFKDLNNGWVTYETQGLFGSNYLARAWTFINALEVLLPTEALYPIHDPTRVSLQTNQAYLFTFSSKPPLGITGFWSLTLYNATELLLPNPENIYAVGDRSNLTYPDGTLVYGTSSSSSEGMFQVVIQSQSNPPPSNWTNK